MPFFQKGQGLFLNYLSKGVFTIRIVLDYGHGGTDPGAIYGTRYEKDDVLKIGRAIAKLLRAKGVTVIESRPTDVLVSLQSRCIISNDAKPDFFVSLHRNAFKPEQATGAETFIFTGNAGEAQVLAANIQTELARIGFKNRGVKRANYHVLKVTTAQAVLVEIGFIDNSADNKLFDARFDDIAIGIANGILSMAAVNAKNVCSVCGK